MECPACGRAIDPLRAGEVAFVDGRFVYFCDRGHKSEWLSSRSTASDEVATEEPPPVAPTLPTQPITGEDEPKSLPIRYWTPSDAVPLSSRRGEEQRDDLTQRDGPSGTVVVAYVGAITGALAVGVALVGASADGARLPLAAVACACALAYVVMVRRSLGLGRIPWVAAIAVAAAFGCGAWARAFDAASPLASTLAKFAGVAAAALVAECMAMVRAVEPIATARAAMLAALPTAPDVRAGEQVDVPAGATVPVDGVVASGEAIVSPWVDATTDVTKREGSPIVAGARVLSGSLRVTATWTGRDRAFCKLLVDANGGGLERAPLVNLAGLIDRRALLPFAVAAGAVSLANGASAVELVGCAAAAVTSFGTPVASFAVWLLHARAQLRALQNGIVYRDTRHFDRAARARIAVVCARGTVLLGEPEIVAIDAVGRGSNDPEPVMALASAVANGSPHPFAAAILRAARARNIQPENVRNTVHSGSGATAADAQGERVVLGRRVFLLAEKVSVAVADAMVREHEAQGRSVLLVSRGGRVVGLVALQDGLRAGARAAIQKLHDAHIEPVLLSGEARETCEAIGRALDIEHLRPEVAGADRGPEVRALAEGGDVVAVLGHPAADDSALSAADVSVALDTAGASPGEWAVALASDDVRAAAEALTLARKARDQSLRVTTMALIPGILTTLALAFQLVPLVVGPLVGLLAASFTLLYAKE
jgi:Cu+-exporting ATPase